MRVGTASRDIVRALSFVTPQLAIRPKSRCSRSYVCLNTNDWLNPLGGGGLVELVGAKTVTVIGDGHRILALRLHLRDELLDLGGAVQHGVFGVHMQVSEILRGHANSLVGPSVRFRAHP